MALSAVGSWPSVQCRKGREGPAVLRRAARAFASNEAIARPLDPARIVGRNDAPRVPNHRSRLPARKHHHRLDMTHSEGKVLATTENENPIFITYRVELSSGMVRGASPAWYPESFILRDTTSSPYVGASGGDGIEVAHTTAVGAIGYAGVGVGEVPIGFDMLLVAAVLPGAIWLSLHPSPASQPS
jgi:hypothetical protein